MCHKCRECGQNFKSKSGLILHKRAKHGAADWGPNRKALEQTLDELDSRGCLEPKDSALVQIACSLADIIDHGKVNAQVWRTYHEVLGNLVERDDSDGAFEKLIEEINSKTPVVHSPAS